MTEFGLPKSVQSGLMYYGRILAGTLAGANTAEIWAGIRAQAEAFGLPRPGISIGTVSMLRRLAGAEARAMRGVGGADPTDNPLTHASVAPWARPLSQRNAAPSYTVRFAVAGQTDENGNQLYRSVKYNAANMPATVAALQADLIVQNAAMAADYGTEDGGILPVLDDGSPAISIQVI